jgi:hypothetical protein
MEGHALPGEWNVFDSGGSAGGLSEIEGFAWPKYILLTIFDPLDIGFDAFIVPNRYLILKLVI